jgi:hypothetical protein
VNAVIESVTAIANGAVGGAAKAIENAMSKALPVIIGFMASLLGLGGITGKIQNIIKKVRGPIEKAIDWVIAQAVKFAKKIGNKLGFGKDKKGNEHEDPEHDAKVAKGLKQIDEEETQYTKNSGKIKREDAEKVAAKVKYDNPIFKSITVVDGGKTWDYKYVASEGKKKGEEKSEESENSLDLKRQPEIIRDRLSYTFYAYDPAADPGDKLAGSIEWKQKDGYITLALYPMDVKIGGLQLTGDRKNLRIPGRIIVHALFQELQNLLGKTIKEFLEDKEFLDAFKENGAEENIKQAFKIKGMNGAWGHKSDNLVTFNRFWLAGNSLEEAARATFTGIMAKDLGFKDVEFKNGNPEQKPNTDIKSRVAFTSVHCIFF